jgi:hypothetical protein
MNAVLTQALRYPAGDNGHRPHRQNLIMQVGPTMRDVLVVGGCGYCSPELSRLVDYYGAELVRKACDSLRARPIRQNMQRLKDWLEATL